MRIRLACGAICLWVLAGCVAARPPQVEAPEPEPVVAFEPSDSLATVVDPGTRIRLLVQEDGVGPLSGTDSLDAAARLLSACLSPPVPDSASENAPAIPPDEALRLARALFAAYRSVLPPSEPVATGTPLAGLIDALPPHFRHALRSDAGYREFYLLRLAGSSDLPVVVNERVREKIRFFQTEAAEVFRSWLFRSGTYGPLIRAALRDEQLPEDLMYLSMVESGFNSRAYSRAAAVGMWQFMLHTGRLYGLQQNTYADERRDPEKATHAAARHLRHLYNLFGDWELVVTAYNYGQGRLERAIRRHGTSDFWQLRDIPAETKNHLPKVLAVLLISKDPAFFGFHDVVYGQPLSFDLVKVSEAVDLRVGADCAGTTYEVMRDLNPELRLGYTPPRTARRAYALRVPRGASDSFGARYAAIPAQRKVSTVEYQVRYGDTLSGIARKVGVSAGALMEANSIRNPRTIRAGQRLKIPVHPRGLGRALLAAEGAAGDPGPGAGIGEKAPQAGGPGERHAYRVRRGDTLWDIARRHGVTPEQVRRWNAIAPGRTIHPGDRLTLHRSTRPDGPVLASAEGPVPQNAAVADITPERSVHTVRAGDTLWGIAKAYNTSVGYLKALNGIRNAARLRIGDRLRVRAEGGGGE